MAVFLQGTEGALCASDDPSYCGDYSFDIKNQIWSLLKESLVPSLCRRAGCKVWVASAD